MEKKGYNQKKCINARRQAADASITRTKVTEKEKFPKARALKIFRMTGNAPYAVPVRKFLNH
jgi:hypothetical protein